MAHRGGQSGNQNATTHGIYNATQPKTESELAAIADLAITERNIAMLKRLLGAPAYAEKAEKRRAIRRLIRTLITQNVLETKPATMRRTDSTSTQEHAPRIARGH